MTEPRPHLILHKVRGEPAWDVAIPMEIGNELGWIIPTSGHRAYPLITWGLDGIVPLLAGARWHMETVESFVATQPNWPTLPDHYSVNDRKERTIARSPGVDDIFEELGL